MKKYQFAYKVVAGYRGNTYQSARYGGTVYYKQDEHTLPPKGTKLFVFDTAEHARAFAFKSEEIWFALVSNPERPKFFTSSTNEIREFWRSRQNKKRILCQQRATPPKGTLFVDSVMLLYRVDN